MGTAKRERQKARRKARLEVEEKAAKRKKSIRRGIIIAIVAVVLIGISYLIFGTGNSSSSTSTTTSSSTTTAASTTTTGASTTTTTAGSTTGTTLAPVVDTAGYTTSANCPSNFSAPLKKKTYSSAPPQTINKSATYTATVTTDIGPFTIKLNPQLAPVTVNNFVFLAEQHFYDCVVFHRVIPSFVDQTGDPTGTGTGGPGYKFKDELPPTANPQYPLGSVAMANSGPSTNGSQFFIVTGAQGESLQPNYSLFGQVTSGLPVLETINKDGSSSGTPVKLHRIVSISVTES